MLGTQNLRHFLATLIILDIQFVHDFFEPLPILWLHDGWLADAMVLAL